MEPSSDRLAPHLLSLLRIVAALIFIEHGTQKLFGFPAAPANGYPEFLSLFWWQGVIEVVGGALLLLGLFHAFCRLHPIRQHGRRLLDGSRTDKFLPCPQWRRRGHPLLLRLSLRGSRRGWILERRPRSQAHLNTVCKQSCRAFGSDHQSELSQAANPVSFTNGASDEPPEKGTGFVSQRSSRKETLHLWLPIKTVCNLLWSGRKASVEPGTACQAPTDCGGNPASFSRVQPECFTRGF